MDERPIGVFDSGVGGLTVLHECLVTLPHEDFVYLGDGARLPYGPRPLEEVRRFAREIGAYLEARGVKLVVVACNSATAAALPELQTELRAPVVGVIAPEAHAAVQATRNRRIGLLGDAGDGGERPLRGARRGARRRRGGLPGRVSAARAADRGRGSVRRGDGRRGARVRGAAEGRGGRHRHPRLHALPADPPDPPARLRPRRHARLLRRGDGPRGRGDARAQADRERRRARGLVPVPHDRRHGVVPRDGPPLPAAADRGGRARRDRHAGGGRHEERRAAAGRPAAHARPDPGLRRAGERLGALLAGEDARALHGDRRGGCAALAAALRPRLDDGRVLAPARVDRRADAARGVAGEAGRPHDRDPAADRPRAPLGVRLPGARRAHALARLRRAPGRRRHPLRRDLRRVRRRARARSTASGSPRR